MVLVTHGLRVAEGAGLLAEVRVDEDTTVWVRVVRLGDLDVVVVITIVLDQSAAGVVKVASELNTVGVDRVDRRNERLTVVLDDNFVV